MVKLSGPVLMNMYGVLFKAVHPFPQSPIHLNQIPSPLSMLVGSQS